MPLLSQIYLYPVKSLAGMQVLEWPVDKNGLQYDRKWMLIDEQHQFLSQRRFPKMALIKTRIENNHLILSAPSQDDLVLSLNPLDGEDIDVGIWKDQCLAKTVSDQADAWLGEFLQIKCRLVYHPDDRQRPVDQSYAKSTDQTAFSDGFPFLIVSENSLTALNQNLPFEVSMHRFRPNLVISDCDSYAEDGWRLININDIEFRLPKPCSRCSVPCIDPDTAISHKEPLAALSRLRKWDNHVYFGQNALHSHNGKLVVGANVSILETGPNQPPIK